MKRSFWLSIFFAVMALCAACWAQGNVTATATAAVAFSLPPALIFVLKMVGFGAILKAILTVNIPWKGKTSDIADILPIQIRAIGIDLISVLVYWGFQWVVGATTVGAVKADANMILLQGLANSSTTSAIHASCPWLDAMIDKVQGVPTPPAS